MLVKKVEIVIRQTFNNPEAKPLAWTFQIPPDLLEDVRRWCQWAEKKVVSKLPELESHECTVTGGVCYCDAGGKGPCVCGPAKTAYLKGGGV